MGFFSLFYGSSVTESPSLSEVMLLSSCDWEVVPPLLPSPTLEVVPPSDPLPPLREGDVQGESVSVGSNSRL